LILITSILPLILIMCMSIKILYISFAQHIIMMIKTKIYDKFIILEVNFFEFSKSP